jgi:hypothetical protein
MSFTEVKEKVLNKYSVKRNSTSGGFWFFFGLGDNPYGEAVERINEKTVKEALHEDWLSISDDFNKVFNIESDKVDSKK